MTVVFTIYAGVALLVFVLVARYFPAARYGEYDLTGAALLGAIGWPVIVFVGLFAALMYIIYAAFNLLAHAVRRR